MQTTSSDPSRSVLVAPADGASLARIAVALAAIFVLALTLRVLWLAETDTVIPPLSDPQYYHATATNLADGRGYSVAVSEAGFVAGVQGEATAFWAPGFSFALAPLYKLFGPDPGIAKGFNAVVGALAVLPVFAIGRRLRGDAAGLLGATIFAVTPTLVFWTASVFSEPLFTLGVATTLALALHAGKRDHVAWYFAMGVALVATAFVRSQGLLLLVPVAVLLVRSFDLRDAVRATAPVAAAIALAVVPWAIRNQIVMGEPTLINNNLGYNLRLAHAPYSTGTSTPPQDLWHEQPGISFKERELLFAELGRERAIDYALSHPLREMELAVKRVLYLFESDAAASISWSESLGRTPIHRWRDAYVLVGDIFWYVMLALAAASLLLLPRTRTWWSLWSMMGVWIALHTVFAGEPRYHVPLVPVIAALSAAVLMTTYERLSRTPPATDG